ncbi:DUF1289 domain-containing protein [Methylobacillus glycogenes]|uniref:DUF1289 domain-containing protein n=1 Tax=Methylobacillus glycogenes TaxID=406 RepID=UPI0009DDE034|nr:DUF1289 domain-containing protein [Methylobacillus glycogenes]
MQTELMQRDEPVASPCVGLCALDDQRQYCLGCQRHLNEIRAWRGMSEDEKLEVLQAIAERKLGAEAKPAL